MKKKEKIMNNKITQVQRFFAAGIYLAIIFICTTLLGGNIGELLSGSTDESIWFYSGILLIVMGQCITEPFFSTPADAFTNSITAILALIAVNNKKGFAGYWIAIAFSCIISILSLIAIATKNKNNKFSKTTYYLVNKFGSSKFIFSLIYLLSAYNYFFKTEKLNYLVLSLAIWICVVFLKLAEKAVVFIKKLIKIATDKAENNCSGTIVRNNSKIVTIQYPKQNKKIKSLEYDYIAIIDDNSQYCIAKIINKRTHIDSIWCDAVLLFEKSNPLFYTASQLKLDLSNKNNDSNLAYSIHLNDLDENVQNSICNNEFVKSEKDFIGYIEQNSDINVIYFSVFSNSENIVEGKIIRTIINGEVVLYQVLNGITKEISEDSSDKYGLIYGKARKLGKYNYEQKELSTVPWVPNTFEKVYICQDFEDVDLEELAKNSIGRLPNTDMCIPLSNIDNLVTHNTAILGILGVGKSCLTFELIKKIVEQSECKVICIDITNQYATNEGLFQYLNSSIILNEVKHEWLDQLKQCAEKTGGKSNPLEWGNLTNYRNMIALHIKEFYSSNHKVCVINPDNHIVKAPMSKFNIEAAEEISVAEKTRIISEEILKYCMELGQTSKARICVVFEEAHSLVPEWNSVSSPGDQNATNGTAKVILQGRKYGLGCILVTQRTANITKSILNQCNTIFALRVFDDTGKTFLENYIGNDYSSMLPTLEERHAITIGKALGLKQPIVIQLNDKKYLKSTEVDNLLES